MVSTCNTGVWCLASLDYVISDYQKTLSQKKGGEGGGQCLRKYSLGWPLASVHTYKRTCTHVWMHTKMHLTTRIHIQRYMSEWMINSFIVCKAVVDVIAKFYQNKMANSKAVFILPAK